MDDRDPVRLDFAWRCHAAEETWASRADTKASILLAANVVGLVGLVGLSSARSSRFSGLFELDDVWRQVGLHGGTLLVALAAVANIMVVFPLLRSRQSKNSLDIIYFGHVRGRSPASLAHQLQRLTVEDQIDQVSRQLVTLARVNWIKYRLMQLALLLSLAGYVMAGLSIVI